MHAESNHYAQSYEAELKSRLDRCVKFPEIFSLPPCMRNNPRAYVENPWDVASYVTKLKTLYRAMHALKRTTPVSDSLVQQYSEWLVPKVDELYAYMREKYTNLSVLSSMMLPVASVLGRELGRDHAITAKWRDEATELRFRADEQASHNVPDEDFKTYQDICHRRDAIRKQLDQEDQEDQGPAQHTIQYWQWFALCLYTMQPPLRADWATMSIIDGVDKALPGQNHLVLTPNTAIILIRHDKVSRRKGGAQIPIKDELRAVLLESIRTFPRSVVVPCTYKASRKALYLSYCPHKSITMINLSHLLGHAMASPDTKTPWSRPVQRLRAAYSTHIMSVPVSYHTMKEVAAAQRHSVKTMLAHYMVVPAAASRATKDETDTDTAAAEGTNRRGSPP